jgi:hypothetical protein
VGHRTSRGSHGGISVCIDLEETSESPGHAVDEVHLEDLLVNGLGSLLVRQQDCSKEGKELIYTDDHRGGHHVKVTLLESNLEVSLHDVLCHEGVNPVSLFVAAVLLELNTILAPGIEEWLPTKIWWGHIDDTAAGHGSWGGVIQVLDFEGHLALVGHWDTFTVGKSQNLVVIEHSVEVLNPNSVDWAVTINPSVELVLLVVGTLPDLGVNTGDPLLGDSVHHTVHLLTLDSLGVHLSNLD